MTKTAAIRVVIDGEGAPPRTGAWGNITIPYACAITGWTLVADRPGNAVLDVQRASFAEFPNVASIVGTEPPTLSGTQQKAENLAVKTWNTQVNAGDVIQVDILSVDTCQRLSLTVNLSVP